MDYEILPLAVTQPEWRVFIDVCQRVLGVSPTRGIDTSHLDVKDPAAFLGSLDMENDPVTALRDPFNPTHSHYTITFIMVLDDAGIGALYRTSLKVFVKDAPRRRAVAIVSGSMDVWYQAIRLGCRDEASYELRWIMNRVLARFEQAGFREVFSDFKKQKRTDETFILRS